MLGFFFSICLWANSCVADIGVMIALDPTLDRMLAKIKNAKIVTKGGRIYYQGVFADTKIVLVQSPMGKVNNAITAQILISDFTVDAILSISPAGAVTEELQQGDLLWVTKVFQHDFGTWKPYGFIWTNVPVQGDNSTPAYNYFLQELSGSLSLQLPEKKSFKQGILVSGDQFIASEKKRQWLRKKFAADATDMGGAAIVQTCFSNNIPVTLLRLITDHADQQARFSFRESVTSPVNTEKMVHHVEKLIHSLATRYSHSTLGLSRNQPQTIQ